MDCGYFNKKKPSVSTSPHLRFFLLQTPMDRKPPRSRALHEYGFQRAYKACVPCSRRKVKCQASEGEKCVRCVKKRIDCIFTSKKPWSRAPKDGQGSRGVTLYVKLRLIRGSLYSHCRFLFILRQTDHNQVPGAELGPKMTIFQHLCCKR